MKSILLTTLNAKYIHSSLALRYLQAYCQQHSALQMELKEFTINEFPADIMARIYRQQPDLLCFSCYIWNIRPILEICRDYKKVSPETIIILGGPEVSYDAESLLGENPGIDFVVRGEGEVTFLELLLALENNQSLTKIAGISYRCGEELYHHPDRTLLSDLDLIPFPYPPDLEAFKEKIIYYESSRGCPFHCSYCLSSTQHGVRYFSLERVKRDLSMLLAQKVREIKFVDRTFNCHEERAMEIMRFLITEAPVSKFHFELDATLLSEKMLDFLQSLPPDKFNFEIGIQSTYPAALQAVQRNTDWDRLSRNVLKLKSYHNIHLHLDLIAGLPYEDYDKFARSFNHVYALQPDVLQLGFLKLLKGSGIRNQSQKHGYIYQDEPPYQVLANQYLGYGQLIDLQAIEEMVEKYHNSGDMVYSLAYIIASVYHNDAFAFFADLAAYWQDNHYFEIGHKKDKLYSYLISFIKEQHGNHADIVNDLLKYDYFMNNRSDLLPSGLRSDNPASVKEEIYGYIKDAGFMKEHLKLDTTKSPREIKKNLHLEYFRWDPETGSINHKLIGIIFVYDPIKKQAFKTVRLR